MVYVFLLNWCFHSTKLPLLRGSNRCAVREGVCERTGENVHLCGRTWRAECKFCVCRCPSSRRHGDPVCSGNSSGEYSHIIFKSSWLRNLCTICEHIPSRDAAKPPLTAKIDEANALQQRSCEGTSSAVLTLSSFSPKQCIRQSVGFRPNRLD